jgi:hypothetical protein
MTGEVLGIKGVTRGTSVADAAAMRITGFLGIALSVLLTGCGSVTAILDNDAGPAGDDDDVPDARQPDAQAPEDAPDACVPRTCAELAVECGVIDDGCGNTVACDPCREGEACGAVVDQECDAPPPLLLRNGFVQSDGRKSYSQTCDLAADGTLDCAIVDHPFSSFGLPPADLPLPDGVGVSDRTVLIYRRAGTTKTTLVSGFLQSDGQKEWIQICDAPSTGPLACDPQTSPYVAVALPPPGLTLDAGTHVGGRFGFVYLVDGVTKVRSGYVQSDGARSFSQDCDVDDDGALDCAPATHPFTALALPTGGIVPDAGTHIGDRFTFTYWDGASQLLRNGFVQSDGARSWSQTCELDGRGGFDCNLDDHPFTAIPLPPSGITLDAGTTVDHRFTFTYAE